MFFGGFRTWRFNCQFSWNGTFRTSRSTACKNESNWSECSLCSFYEKFPYSTLFLGGIKSVQGSRSIRWNFWFVIRSRETPDILITKVEFILYPRITQAWNLAAPRKISSSKRIQHWNQILNFFWVPGLVFYRGFDHVQGFHLIFPPVFISISGKENQKLFMGLAVHTPPN